MIKLNKITVKEYFDLEDKSEYDFAMKYAFIFNDAVDEYEIGDMQDLPFGKIKDLQYEFEQGISNNRLMEIASELSGIKSFANEPLDKLWRFLNYLKESMLSIIENERKLLSHEPSDLEKRAGLTRFEGLGIGLQIRELAGNDITKREIVKQLPYSLCFLHLYEGKQISDFKQRISEIQAEDARHKK